jgi:ferredoxin-NADP reductase
MVKYLDDTNDLRQVTLLYGERSVQDVAYSDVFEAARQHIGTKTVYVINNEKAVNSSKVRVGTITPELIQAELPDYQERLFYVSGPPTMVRSIRKTLLELGVAHKNIKVDFFVGYA